MRHLLKRFIQREASSSIILFAMTLVALIWANSPLDFIHDRFVENFLFFINEVLMAIFFLLVGIELKKGFIEGELNQLSQILLPLVAAIGGMIIPACIYWLFNAGNPDTLKGWATPVATDIAFAVGTLALFGKRIPNTLKLFLLALAIFDDIGAIIIITLFYSHGLSYFWIVLSVVIVLILYLLNILGIRLLIPYLLLGICLWFCLLYAGIHPTISGVLLALTLPNDSAASPLYRLESLLHPWVAFFIMPIFALANAGFSFSAISWHSLTDTIVLGIVFGLFIGKQVGIFGFSWLLIRFKLAKLPDKCNWLELYGVAILCGIGFTMSLFLGTLSFQHQNTYLAEVRFGVIIGSILSGLVGAFVLLISRLRLQKN